MARKYNVNSCIKNLKQAENEKVRQEQSLRDLQNKLYSMAQNDAALSAVQFAISKAGQQLASANTKVSEMKAAAKNVLTSLISDLKVFNAHKNVYFSGAQHEQNAGARRDLQKGGLYAKREADNLKTLIQRLQRALKDTTQFEENGLENIIADSSESGLEGQFSSGADLHTPMYNIIEDPRYANQIKEINKQKKLNIIFEENREREKLAQIYAYYHTYQNQSGNHYGGVYKGYRPKYALGSKCQIGFEKYKDYFI